MPCLKKDKNNVLDSRSMLCENNVKNDCFKRDESVSTIEMLLIYIYFNHKIYLV